VVVKGGGNYPPPLTDWHRETVVLRGAHWHGILPSLLGCADPDPLGSVYYWLSWIRIRIYWYRSSSFKTDNNL